MDDAMVTSRMSAAKKQKGARFLQQENLNASQAINLMYDRLIEEGGVDFLLSEKDSLQNNTKWAAAAHFVDSISSERSSKFDEMSKAEIKYERLRSQGLE